MAFDAAIADGLLSRRRMGWSETIALALTAVAVALGAACVYRKPYPGFLSEELVKLAR